MMGLEVVQTEKMKSILRITTDNPSKTQKKKRRLSLNMTDFQSERLAART